MRSFKDISEGLQDRIKLDTNHMEIRPIAEFVYPNYGWNGRVS